MNIDALLYTNLRRAQYFGRKPNRRAIAPLRGAFTPVHLREIGSELGLLVTTAGHVLV